MNLTQTLLNFNKNRSFCVGFESWLVLFGRTKQFLSLLGESIYIYIYNSQIISINDAIKVRMLPFLLYQFIIIFRLPLISNLLM